MKETALRLEDRLEEEEGVDALEPLREGGVSVPLPLLLPLLLGVELRLDGEWLCCCWESESALRSELSSSSGLGLWVLLGLLRLLFLLVDAEDEVGDNADGDPMLLPLPLPLEDLLLLLLLLLLVYRELVIRNILRDFDELGVLPIPDDSTGDVGISWFSLLQSEPDAIPTTFSSPLTIFHTWN